MKKWVYLVPILLLICCEITEAPKQIGKSKFTPPKDNKITKEMARSYIDASTYLLKAIASHEKFIEEFTNKYNLSHDLSELADSLYRETHQDVIRAWDELVRDWEKNEKNAYKKAGITEDEFNWIGGALTDPTNKDMQEEIAKTLGGK